MPETGKSLVQKFRNLSVFFRGLSPEDKSRIVQIGSQLEVILSDIPPQFYKVISLVNLILLGLESLYEDRVDDPGSLINAIEMSLAAAGNFLADNPDKLERLNASGTALWVGLGRNPGESPYLNNGHTSKKTPALDEIAALFIAARPDDLIAYSHLKQSIIEYISDNGTPREIVGILAQTVTKLDTILIAGFSNPETLTAIQSLIESAVKDYKGSQNAHTVIMGNETEPSRFQSGQNITTPQSSAGLIADFVTESLDYIEQAEEFLLSLEKDPGNGEAVNIVFRALHSIKGTSSFLNLALVADLAHWAENLLSRIREKKIRYAGGYADLALCSVDMLKSLIESVRNSLGGEPMVEPGGYGQLLAMLKDPEANGISDAPRETGSGMTIRIGDILVSEGKVSRKTMEECVAQKGSGPIGRALIKSKIASLVDVGKALRTQQKIIETNTSTDSSARVRTEHLERFIELVGKLAQAHSIVVQDKTVLSADDSDLLQKIQHATQLVSELQDLSMLMRMVSFKSAFQKMARLTRDLAQKSGKIVNFVCEGDDTVVDRTIVEIISDPLVHMIRNSVDHGIEYPEERIKIGKPPGGIIRLAAYYQGSSVFIEVQDDGKGLDRQKIIDKAVEKGLIQAGKEITEDEVFNLIFLPGFSTAEIITEVSGRGVGMDVVKKNVALLKGKVDIISKPMIGTKFIVELPIRNS